MFIVTGTISLEGRIRILFLREPGSVTLELGGGRYKILITDANHAGTIAAVRRAEDGL